MGLSLVYLTFKAIQFSLLTKLRQGVFKFSSEFNNSIWVTCSSIREDLHPSTVRSGRNKEGLSLFGICDRTGNGRNFITLFSNCCWQKNVQVLVPASSFEHRRHYCKTRYGWVPDTTLTSRVPLGDQVNSCLGDHILLTVLGKFWSQSRIWWTSQTEWGMDSRHAMIGSISLKLAVLVLRLIQTELS